MLTFCKEYFLLNSENGIVRKILVVAIRFKPAKNQVMDSRQGIKHVVQ